MTSWIRRYWNDDFWKNNLVLLGGSLAIGILNYSYYPVLSRLMHVTQFGEVQVLVSLFLQVSVLFSAVNIVVINISAPETTRQSHEVLNALEKMFLISLSLLSLLASLSTPIMQRFLHIDSPWPFFALILAFIVSAPLVFRVAYLQGVKDFSGVVRVGILSSGIKILTSALLVFAGFGVTGAIFGLVVAQAFAYRVVYVRSRKAGFSPSFDSISWRRSLKLVLPQLQYGGLVFIVLLATTFLFSFDIIIIKHLFSPSIAGLYAGISVIARIIFFLTASIGGVLLASVSPSFTNSTNLRTLYRSLGLLGLVGGPAVLVMSFCPEIVVSVLVGPKYLSAAYLLPGLSLAMFIISAVNLVLYYFLALRRWSAATIAVSGVLGAVILLIISHADISAIILDLIIGCSFMLLLLVLWEYTIQVRVNSLDKV